MPTVPSAGPPPLRVVEGSEEVREFRKAMQEQWAEVVKQKRVRKLRHFQDGHRERLTPQELAAEGGAPPMDWRRVRTGVLYTARTQLAKRFREELLEHFMPFPVNAWSRRPEDLYDDDSDELPF